MTELPFCILWSWQDGKKLNRMKGQVFQLHKELSRPGNSKSTGPELGIYLRCLMNMLEVG